MVVGYMKVLRGSWLRVARYWTPTPCPLELEVTSHRRGKMIQPVLISDAVTLHKRVPSPAKIC